MEDVNAKGKCLVTGAGGFIGFHLSRRLLKLGYSVTGFDNMNNYYDVGLKERRIDLLSKHDGFCFIKGDLKDEAALSAVFKENRPDCVVNLAAQAGVRYSIENPGAYIDSNLVGFFNLLEAVRKNPVRHLVFASSSSVYGNQTKTSFSVEDRADRPVSLYAATKRSNELMAYAYSSLYGIPATGLRFFTVYGPYGRPDMAYFSFTRSIMEGKPIKIFNYGDLYRDFTYIDDIVSGIENVLISPPKQDDAGVRFKVYNIGNNKPVRLDAFIDTLEMCLGKKAIREYLPMQQGDVYTTYADVDDLMNDFGFAPDTPLEVGLSAFTEWYREYYGE